MTSPSRFHNLSNEALADMIGKQDALVKTETAELDALKAEMKARAGDRDGFEVTGERFVVSVADQLANRLDNAKVRKHLGKCAAELMTNVEIISDGRTVWINDATGHCIGRFGRFGVDVHKTAREQANGGECLDCFHSGDPASQWNRFVASMAQFHAVAVSEKFRPKWIPEPK